jgi:hypothetical protein
MKESMKRGGSDFPFKNRKDAIGNESVFEGERNESHFRV